MYICSLLEHFGKDLAAFACFCQKCVIDDVIAGAAAGQAGRTDAAHGTHVSFGRRGDKLLVTYHGDHAYTFDVTGAGAPAVALGRPSKSGGERSTI